MHNKYKSCQWCPDRTLECRKTCDGWQAREQEKALRYEIRSVFVGGCRNRTAVTDKHKVKRLV